MRNANSPRNPKSYNAVAEPQSGPKLSNADVAKYIGDITAELALLAGSRRMAMLTYFLNMARVEAEQQWADATQSAKASRTLEAG